MRIISLNKATHELEGIVYSASGEKDSQGDYIAKEDCHILSDAMEDFNSRWEKGDRSLFNLNHDNKKILEGAELLESFLTDKETLRETEKGNMFVPGCSWIIKLKLSEEAFKLVEGATGLSMQGVGQAEEE